jgi:hypothetical protein
MLANRHHAQVANLARLHQRAQCRDGRHVAILKPYPSHDIYKRCAPHDCLAVLDRGAHGLLDEHVNTGVEHVVKHLSMSEIGGSNDDRIHKARCQQVSIVGELGRVMRRILECEPSQRQRLSMWIGNSSN